MDNSKRVSYSLSAYSQNFRSSIYQTYEFTNNSNFHVEQGNDDHLSDLLGTIEYFNINKLSYNFRYDFSDSYLKNSNIDFKSNTKYGNINISYLDQNSKVNIITKDTET